MHDGDGGPTFSDDEDDDLPSLHGYQPDEDIVLAPVIVSSTPEVSSNNGHSAPAPQLNKLSYSVGRISAGFFLKKIWIQGAGQAKPP